MVNLIVKKRGRRFFKYILIRLVLFLVQALPENAAESLASGLSRLAWLVLAKERKKALFNLRLVFPGQTDHQRLGREVFRQMALSAVTAVNLHRLSDQELNRRVVVEGLEHFDAAYRLGRGVVAITGHIGCWELIPAWFSRQGYRISVVGKRMNDERLDRLLTRLRSGQGVRVIDRDSGAREALRDLRSGHALGVLIDQDTRVASVDTEFFGLPARTPSGAAALAERTGAPVVPLAIHRQPDGRHTITIKPALEFDPSLGREDRIRDMVQRQTAALEEFVRQDITQWVWMHLRWKEKPAF